MKVELTVVPVRPHAPQSSGYSWTLSDVLCSNKYTLFFGPMGIADEIVKDGVVMALYASSIVINLLFVRGCSVAGSSGWMSHSSCSNTEKLFLERKLLSGDEEDIGEDIGEEMLFGLDFFFVVGDWLVVLGRFLAGIGVIISGDDGGVEFGDGKGDEGTETGDVIFGFGVDLSLPSKLKWRPLGILPETCFGVEFPQLLKPKLNARFLLVSAAADFGTMGTKWFGVQVLFSIGGEVLDHMILIGLSQTGSFGLSSIFNFKKAKSLVPFTQGYKTSIFVLMTLDKASIVQTQEYRPMWAHSITARSYVGAR